MASLKAAYLLCIVTISIVFGKANKSATRLVKLDSSFPSSKIIRVHAPEEHTDVSSVRTRRTTSRPGLSVTPDVVVVS